MNTRRLGAVKTRFAESQLRLSGVFSISELQPMVTPQRQSRIFVLSIQQPRTGIFQLLDISVCPLPTLHLSFVIHSFCCLVSKFTRYGLENRQSFFLKFLKVFRHLKREERYVMITIWFIVANSDVMCFVHLSSSGEYSLLALKISMKQCHSSVTSLLNGACHTQA